MKLFWIMLTVVLLPGCTGASLLNTIPDHEFTKLTYDRTGNFTSAHIDATGAKREGNTLTIEDITVIGDYGPIYSIKMHIEGYSRMTAK